MIHFFAILSLLLCGVCYTGFQKEEDKCKFQNITRFVWIIFGAALLLRLILAYTTHGAMILPVLLRGLTGSSP